MSTWRSKAEEATPSNFTNLLYGDEEEVLCEVDGNEFMFVDPDETEDYSNQELTAEGEINGSQQSAIPVTVKMEIEENAEVHDNYVSEGSGESNDTDDEPLNDKTSVRGRGVKRGRGGVARGRGSRGGRGVRSLAMLLPRRRGDRPTEVNPTDEDVPPLLRALLMGPPKDRPTCEKAQKEVTQRETPEKKNTEVKEENLSETEGNEEFYDGDDRKDETLLINEVDRRFEWSPMSTFKGQKEKFVPETTGSVKHHATVYDAFRAYWTDDILDHIASETNRYAVTIPSESFQKEWYDTNIHEILILFAIWTMMGIIRMPTIKACFSSDPLLKTEVFCKMFTYKRYNNLVRALHFANNDIKPSNASRLYCMAPVIDHLNDKFQESYIPSQNICIDESLTLWNGMLLFKQRVKSKVPRLGIKTFELCDSVTGYLWSFSVYTGESSDEFPQDSSLLKSTATVLKLIKPLLNKGYTLFLDDWFNTPILARYLKRNRTDCVGTLRPSRRGIPPLLAQTELQPGQFLARHSGDVCVMAWQDKEKVMTISTYHATDLGLTNFAVHGASRFQQWKPQVMLDYSKYMGGVDRKDQMLEPYLMERKRCRKWYMKLFKRLLNCSILNARILIESTKGKSEDHLAFRLRLVDLIMTKHLSFCPQNRPRKMTNNMVLDPSRLDTRHDHWPVRVPQTAASSEVNRRARQRCTWCIRRGATNKKTGYKCEKCDVPLCIEGCFKQYHTDL